MRGLETGGRLQKTNAWHGKLDLERKQNAVSCMTC